MFRKFKGKDNISSIKQLKSSSQKLTRAKILSAYPLLLPYIDTLMCNKGAYRIAKYHKHIEMLLNCTGEQLFFRQYGEVWIPTLRLLHKYPFILANQQVDKGAIQFLLSGANVMCPGLTSPGGRITAAEAGTIVAIMAEGKAHALAIGILTQSTDDIAKVNKGIGIEVLHFLNDGLWKLKPLK